MSIGLSREKPISFLALDFETANHIRNSACAVGLVKVRDNQVIQKASFLFKPPQKWFVFTYLHGISWEQVKNKPSLDGIWPALAEYFNGIDFIAAHNASFDQSVLQRCCEYYGLDVPRVPFLCTLKISREMWNIYPTTLADVCRKFGIPLNHHDALSDTEACAQIMLKAIEDGYKI